MVTPAALTAATGTRWVRSASTAPQRAPCTAMSPREEVLRAFPLRRRCDVGDDVPRTAAVLDGAACGAPSGAVDVVHVDDVDDLLVALGVARRVDHRWRVLGAHRYSSPVFDDAGRRSTVMAWFWKLAPISSTRTRCWISPL